MPNTTTTQYMGLVLPIPTSEVGPAWASELVAALTAVDQHDHSSGKGTPVPTSGLSINADLPFGSNNAIGLRSARFTAQGSPLALGSDLGCMYVSGVDLYYNDGSGNQIRLTASGGIAGTPGSIAGLTSPASASYSAGSSTFVWQSDTSTPANMDMAAIILRNLTANSKGLTISPPNAMAANYALTLPALPGSTLPLTLDTSGNVVAAVLTRAMLATPGSAAVGPTTGVSGATLTTGTITTTGGPVILSLSGTVSVFSGGNATLTLKRDSTTIYTATLVNPNAANNTYPASVWNFTDTGASAGAHTYSVVLSMPNAGGGTGSFTSVTLLANEVR